MLSSDLLLLPYLKFSPPLGFLGVYAAAALPQQVGQKPFYLASNGTCLRCDPEGELGCDDTQGCKADGTCVACAAYYRLVDGKCVSW